MSGEDKVNNKARGARRQGQGSPRRRHRRPRPPGRGPDRTRRRATSSRPARRSRTPSSRPPARTTTTDAAPPGAGVRRRLPGLPARARVRGQRRARRARTAGSRGRSAGIQSRPSSSSAPTQRTCACSWATGRPLAIRAHHTRSVEAPGAPPPTTPSRSTSPRNDCGTIAHAQLLPDLAHQRGQVGLPRLHLAAGELPAAVVGPARALRDEHAVAVDDRGADDLHHVQRPPRGGRGVGVEVRLHRPQDAPAQHHLVDQAAERRRAARSPSRPARRRSVPAPVAENRREWVSHRQPEPGPTA